MMTIKELQAAIVRLEQKNGWDNSADEKVVFAIEELGEVAKWVRKARKPTFLEKERDELSLELADLLQHIVSLANAFEIDLEQGLRSKKGI